MMAAAKTSPLWRRARAMYRSYRTASREYEAVAAALGYTRGDLTKRLNAERKASRR